MAQRMLRSAPTIAQELTRSITRSNSNLTVLRPRAEQSSQQFLKPLASDYSQGHLLLSGLPSTALPSDILRLLSQDVYSNAVVDRTSVRAENTDQVNLRRFVAEVRPCYEPTSLRSSGKFLIKVVHHKHSSKLEEHLSRKYLSARSIKVSRVQDRDLQRLITYNVVDMTTPQGSMQTLYNIRPGDREQVSKLLNAIITASPGRLVLLRGLPPGVPPSIVEARLSRAYALVEPARWRVRCFNKAKESWDGIAVHPVMRLYTAYRAAGPSQWSIGEDSDHGVVGNRNNIWNVDQNHIDLDLANQDPDATATFLIRLRTSDDAQRLCRSFNRKTWDEVPRKAIRSKVRAILRHRRDFGSELPRFEEAAENDHDSASRQGDGGQEHGAEEVTEETSDGTKRMEPSEDQDSWSKEYTQLLARETESKRNARQYLVEAQIMY